MAESRATDGYQGAEGAPALTISGPNLGPNVERRDKCQDML